MEKCDQDRECGQLPPAGRVVGAGLFTPRHTPWFLSLRVTLWTGRAKCQLKALPRGREETGWRQRGRCVFK